MEEEQVVRQVETRLRSDYGLMLPFLAALDAAGRTDAADPVLARRMLDAGLEGLEDLTTDRVTGGALASRQGPALERYFLRVIEHEDHGRDHLGLPAPIPQPVSALAPITPAATDAIVAMLAEVREQQAATNARIAELTAAKAEKLGPLFSQAADTYIEQIREANGEHHEEVRYLRHRTAVFTLLCGDKPVAAYTRKDLQHFVNEVRYLLPNISKSRGYDIGRTREYIEAAKREGTPGLSENTLKRTYLNRIRTVRPPIGGWTGLMPSCRKWPCFTPHSRPGFAPPSTASMPPSKESGSHHRWIPGRRRVTGTTGQTRSTHVPPDSAQAIARRVVAQHGGNERDAKLARILQQHIGCRRRRLRSPRQRLLRHGGRYRMGGRWSRRMLLSEKPR